MRILREVGFCYHLEGGNVIDYHGDKLEDVDGDELSVFVVRFEEKCPTLNCDILSDINDCQHTLKSKHAKRDKLRLRRRRKFKVMVVIFLN